MKFKLNIALGGMFVARVCFLGAAGTVQARLQDQSTAQTAQGSAANKQFIESFEKRWSAAKDLAVAVADAMPAESYDFKPVPAEMSFGEQILHIAQANYGKCAVMA